MPKETVSRFHLLPLPNRMTRRTSGEDDEDSLNKLLQEAGIDFQEMSYNDKKQLAKTLQDSKEKHAEEEEVRRQQQFHFFQTEANSEYSGTPSGKKPVLGDKLDTSTTSNRMQKSSDQSCSHNSPPSPSTLISEDESSNDNEDVSRQTINLKQLSINLVKVDAAQQQQSPSQKPPTPQQSPQITKTMGRGRATPTVRSLADCSPNTSQRQVEQWYQSCVQEVTHSLDRETKDENDPNDLAAFIQAAKFPNSDQNSDQNSMKESFNSGVLKKNIDNGSLTIRSLNNDPKESLNKSTNDNDPALPTSEELDVSASSDPSTATKKSTIKTQHGNLITTVSPFQDCFKSKYMEVDSYPPHFRGLEKFRGDKLQWTSEAKKLFAAARVTRWKHVLSKNSKWKDSIVKTGSNCQSLFRRSTYSGLFGDTGSFASKRATASSSETVWNSNRQPSGVGRISQSQRDEKDLMSQEEKLTSSYGSASTSDNLAKQGHSYKNMESGNSRQNTQDDEGWHSSMRSEKKLKFRDGEHGSDPSSPSSNTVFEDADVYEFEDKSDDSDWKPAASTRSRRGGKKSGKANFDSELEIQGKQPQRSRGAQAKKSRGARVSRGAISRPSEHVHHAGNGDSRKLAEESLDEQAIDENQANNERSGWLSTENPKLKENVGIEPSAFFDKKQQRGTYRKIDSVPVRTNRRVSAQNKPLEDSNVDNSRIVSCPICNGQFKESDIVAHASGCQEFQPAVEGDLQHDDSGSGGDSIEVMTNSNQPATGTMPSSSLTCDSPSNQCQLCSEHFSSAELTIHLKECTDKHAFPPSGQKRASSEDDGPARKTSKRLSLKK